MDAMIETARTSIGVLRDHTRMLGQMNFRDRDTHVMAIHRALDALQAEVIVLTAEREAWQATAREYATGLEFYRDLVTQTGAHFGPAAYTSDDGSVQDSVLALKVPELAAAVLAERDALALTLQLRDDQVVRTQRALMEARVQVATVLQDYWKMIPPLNRLHLRSPSDLLTPLALPLTDPVTGDPL